MACLFLSLIYISSQEKEGGEGEIVPSKLDSLRRFIVSNSERKPGYSRDGNAMQSEKKAPCWVLLCLICRAWLVHEPRAESPETERLPSWRKWFVYTFIFILRSSNLVTASQDVLSLFRVISAPVTHQRSKPRLINSAVSSFVTGFVAVQTEFGGIGTDSVEDYKQVEDSVVNYITVFYCSYEIGSHRDKKMTYSWTTKNRTITISLTHALRQIEQYHAKHFMLGKKKHGSPPTVIYSSLKIKTGFLS